MQRVSNPSPFLSSPPPQSVHNMPVYVIIVRSGMKNGKLEMEEEGSMLTRRPAYSPNGTPLSSQSLPQSLPPSLSPSPFSSLPPPPYCVRQWAFNNKAIYSIRSSVRRVLPVLVISSSSPVSPYFPQIRNSIDPLYSMQPAIDLSSISSNDGKARTSAK